MKLLDRYIIKTVLNATALVTLLLTGLQIFILFVNQIEDIGKGGYSLWPAMFHVLLQTPYQVYLFFPIASLLGALIGLGLMANNRELIVMRAAGMSVAQITLSVFKATLVLIALMTLIGEILIPQLSYQSNKIKIQALTNGQTLRTAQGVWLRHQNDFIAISNIAPHNTLQNVFQFRFDTNHRLILVRKISHIAYQNPYWLAYNVDETYIQNTATVAHHADQQLWDVPIKPALLQLSSTEPDELTLPQLKQYLKNQKKNKQAALSYQLAFWQRIMQPLTTLVMMMLAIPFIFGPLRSSTMGAKLLAGAACGFSFHILNRFLGAFSQVYHCPPLVAAACPTLFFALLGLYLMKRVR